MDRGRRIGLANGTTTVGELEGRVHAVATGVVHLKEVNGQTTEGAEITLGRVRDLIAVGPTFPVVIVDLTEATSKPSPAYREMMTKWASELPAFHAAYVLPPVGAITRMALRFVVGRMMAGHPESTSSFHVTYDEALVEAERRVAAFEKEA